MTRSIFVTVLTLGFALSAAAQETPAPDANATLTDTTGRVSVNTGEGFAPAIEDMRLKPGDRVMAQNNSEARIKFDNDCDDEDDKERVVTENKIVTIPSDQPCAGAWVEQALNPGQGGAIGTAGTAGPGNAAGGLIVAAWAAIGYCWLKCDDDDNEDDDDTVSP